MTTIEQTPLARLESEGRLFNAVLKGPTTKDGRFGFRGDIALKFQPKVADEMRPPDYSIEQVLTYSEGNDPQIPILIGYLHSFEYLRSALDVLGDLLSPNGTYLLFCNNIDLRSQYKVKMGDITFHILPCDESTVWKETLELMSIDKNDIKKLNTAGKTDYVLDAVKGFSNGFDEITYEKGLELMEPVRNRNENRPV
ncbi:hypothetical protein [Roseibium marinum]|uniref:Methyltransferase n=1 Tax=Roseibium marinum TaxID=281252 RepID=A0A2S3V2D8_9HYPH|nr:hypothetical protein [Roseibium marinum]POF33849.1 hypothetical protein CLV41_101298 [Roseibium marinum]